MRDRVVPDPSAPKRLKNVFYAALPKAHGEFRSQFVWRGTQHEGKHGPIYTADEWARLQASFGQRPTYRTYERQLARVRSEKSEGATRLEAVESDFDDAYLRTAHRTLELAKSAKSRWDLGSPEQKRDLAAEVVCNPRLAGRSARFSLRKPYDVLAEWSQIANGVPSGIRPGLRDSHLPESPSPRMRHARP